MGVEKGHTNGGAFFNLLDWSKKTRRKLFANGVVSPETKNARKNNGISPAASDSLRDDFDEVDIRSALSFDGSSDCNCSSPVAADDGMGTKAPGVIAKLMGLDYLPIVGTTESYHGKKTSEGESDEQSNNRIGRHEICLFKPLHLKHQNVPSSPIERFQREILPTRPVKSLPITDCKLLSPIRTPYFISSIDPAHIMEAAGKILEPNNQCSSRLRSSPLSCRTLRVRDNQVCIGAPRKPSRILESYANPVEPNGTECLINRPFGRRWSGSENEAIYISPTWNNKDVMHTKDKVKSTLLSSQSKMNIHKKEGSSMKCDSVKSNKSSRSNLNPQSNKMKKNGSSSSSRILEQNNQKQNILVSSDLPPDNLVRNCHLHGESHLREGTLVRNKTPYKRQAKTRTQSDKECQLVGVSGKKPCTLQVINNARKKRITDGANCNEKNVLSANTWMCTNEKRIQHNVIIEKKSMQDEDRRINNMDVVSFTFTSPIAKSMSATLSSVGIEKDGRNCSHQDSSQQEFVTNTKNKLCSTVDLSVINGDALGLLLEQKLRELTSALESPQNNFVPSMTGVTSSQESLGASERKEEALEFLKDFVSSFEEGAHGPLFTPESPSIYGFDPSHNPEVDFPIQEAESLDECSINGGTRLCSFVHSEDTAGSDLSRNKPSLEGESEIVPYHDSVVHSNGDNIDCCPSALTNPRNWEIDYAREIISASQLEDKDPELGFTLRNSLSRIFDQLEDQTSNTTIDNSKDSKLNRKVLFDSVCEGLDSTLMHNFRLGYRSWAKNKVLPQVALADEIYKDISVWRSLHGSMADEHMEDMSIHSGRWADFEIDAFHIGLEIEKQLLRTLISEMVAEFLA